MGKNTDFELEMFSFEAGKANQSLFKRQPLYFANHCG